MGARKVNIAMGLGFFIFAPTNTDNHDILEVLRQESRARGVEWMQAGWLGEKVENFPTSSHQYRRI